MDQQKMNKSEEKSLDPDDWSGIRRLGHRMIDDMMDFLENIKEAPVWKPLPSDTKEFFKNTVPKEPTVISEVYEEFRQHIFPYAKGSVHPRFWAWVQGTGTPFGVLADFLASAMNSNVAIGEHSATYVDAQVIEWCKQILGYPETASGILVSGGSVANLTALIVARNTILGKSIRKEGLNSGSAPIAVMYCSSETHSSVFKAAEVIGVGNGNVRKIQADNNYRINTGELRTAIERDLADGYKPFCVVGNAGTVNTGAIDDLAELKNIAEEYGLWLHVDGAFGAFARLVPGYEQSLAPLEKADSLAFDLHKWMYMPYEVGCVLVRDAEAHRAAFSMEPDYLLKHERGLASGPEPASSYGIELSRGFKALKIWMSLKEHGLKSYAGAIARNIAQASYLGHLVTENDSLELLAPVTMNIVCYRFAKEGISDSELNAVNKEITMRLQEEGIASPSSTLLGGKYAIRVAITNHRSRESDFETLASETVRLGRLITG